jgi:hypothetical protein
VGDDELSHSLEVVDVQCHILTHCRRAGIARGDEELAAQAALRDLIGDGVLASARSKKKDIHIVSVYVSKNNLQKYKQFPKLCKFNYSIIIIYFE